MSTTLEKLSPWLFTIGIFLFAPAKLFAVRPHDFQRKQNVVDDLAPGQ